MPVSRSAVHDTSAVRLRARRSWRSHGCNRCRRSVMLRNGRLSVRCLAVARRLPSCSGAMLGLAVSQHRPRTMRSQHRIAACVDGTVVEVRGTIDRVAESVAAADPVRRRARRDRTVAHVRRCTMPRRLRLSWFDAPSAESRRTLAAANQAAQRARLSESGRFRLRSMELSRPESTAAVRCVTANVARRAGMELGRTQTRSS